MYPLPMGAKVERAIREVEAKGHSKGSAIAILKSSGAIHQSGKHLAKGPSLMSQLTRHKSKSKD